MALKYLKRFRDRVNEPERINKLSDKNIVVNV